MNRRGFLQGILAASVAPAFVGSSVLMPVKALAMPNLAEVATYSGNTLLTIDQVTQEALRIFHQNLQFKVDADRFFKGRNLLTIRVPNQYHAR